MQRRDVLKLGAGAAMPGLGASSQSARPNILIIMTDQQRAGLTKRTGFPLDTMPTLDRLAGQGTAFDCAYTTAPLCVPARVSLLTGRWPHAHRVRQNSNGRHASFSKDLFHVFKEAGYRTGLAGKNHSHLTADRLDFYRPYGHQTGFMPSNAPKEYREFDTWMKQNSKTSTTATPFPFELQHPYRIVSDSMEFIDSCGDQPFVLWTSFPEPHNPYQAPKPYFDLFPLESIPRPSVGTRALQNAGFRLRWLRQLELSAYPDQDAAIPRMRANYLGMLRLIDDQTTRLLKHLEGRGKASNTIVVYLSDHGDSFGDYGLERKGVDLPESLIRVPMVWSGWNIARQPDPGAHVSLADVLPTLCEATGAPVPLGAQGRSMWPMLCGQPYPTEEFASVYAEVGFGGMYYTEKDSIDPRWGRFIGPDGKVRGYDSLNTVTQCGNKKMIRRGDWKLTFDMVGNGRLYNLAYDPDEQTDLYSSRDAADIRHQLTAELLQWTIRTQDDLPTGAYATKWPQRNWYTPHKGSS